MADAKTILTPEFRVSFPTLFRPKAAQQGGKEKFSISMLFPPGADLAALKAAAAAAVKEMWGDKIPSKLKSPFLDAGEYEYEGYNKGWTLIRATSIQKPGVVDRQVKPILDESEIYAGCWARATVRPFAYDQSGNRGVSFGLQNIQKLRDDEPISGRSRAEDDFEAVSDDAVGEAASVDDIFK